MKPALRAELKVFLEAVMERVHAAYPIQTWVWIEQGADQGYPPNTCLLQVQFEQGFEMDSHFPVHAGFICTEGEVKAGTLAILRHISVMVGPQRRQS